MPLKGIKLFLKGVKNAVKRDSTPFKSVKMPCKKVKKLLLFPFGVLLKLIDFAFLISRSF